MHNPHNKTYLFIHIIWSVKNREKLLTKPVRVKLYEYILQNAKAKDIHILNLNGIEDHVHCLLQLHPAQSVSSVVQMMKGGSAFWLNQNNLMGENLKWQDGYAAYSISPLAVEKVMRYIDKQEEYHCVKTLDDELKIMDAGNIGLNTTG